MRREGQAPRARRCKRGLLSRSHLAGRCPPGTAHTGPDQGLSACSEPWAPGHLGTSPRSRRGPDAAQTTSPRKPRGRRGAGPGAIPRDPARWDPFGRSAPATRVSFPHTRSTFLPQGFCTCCALCLEHCSPRFRVPPFPRVPTWRVRPRPSSWPSPEFPAPARGSVFLPNPHHN